MGLTLATWLVRLTGAYLAIGLAFAIPFAFMGVGRIDPVARDGTVGFRLLILPGAAALWPLLAWRLITGRTAPSVEQNPPGDSTLRRGSSPDPEAGS